MKILGIDYGTKRIGLATTDENNTLAFPKSIIFNDSHTFKNLDKIIKEDKIQAIVVGESTNFRGEPNTLASRIEVFIKELEKKFQLPVYKQKEFLTSIEARKRAVNKKNLSRSGAHSKLKKTKSDKVDASAAALILQRYLDKKNLSGII